MLKNAYFLAKIGVDTAENEQHFAEILPIGRRVAEAEAGEPRAPGGPRAAERDRRGRRAVRPAPTFVLIPGQNGFFLTSNSKLF